MFERHTTLILMALSASLVLSACQDDQPGCRNDLDCNEGRICVERACIVEDDPTPEPSPEPDPEPTPTPDPTPDTPDASEDVIDPPEDVIDPPEDIVEEEVGEDVPDESAPNLQISPEAIDFGVVTQGDTAEAILSLTNTGDAPLTLSRISLGAPLDSGFDLETPDDLPLDLDPDETLEVPVAFSPSRLIGQAVTGVVIIGSNDPDEPEIQVPISGTGILDREDCAILIPDGLDLGDLEVGQIATGEARLRNCGGRALSVESFSVTGEDSFLRVDLTDVLDRTIRPGESGAIRVTYSPQAPGRIEATLAIVTDIDAEASMTITGSAGPPPSECALEDVPLLEPGSLGFNLCLGGENFGNIHDLPECGSTGDDFPGRDQIFRIELDRDRRVRLQLKDDDDEVGIDTVLYVRTACEEADSQILCGDDISCRDSDIEFGCDDPNLPQVRHSLIEADLGAGTYYVIADQYSYSNFTCGLVELIYEFVEQD